MFDADSDRHPVTQAIVTLDAVPQLQRGRKGAHGVVAVRTAQPEDGHHCIANELLDRAAVSRDNVLGDRVIARKQGAQILRIQRLAKRGRAA